MIKIAYVWINICNWKHKVIKAKENIVRSNSAKIINNLNLFSSSNIILFQTTFLKYLMLIPNSHDLNVNTMTLSEEEILDYLISINEKVPNVITPIFYKKCWEVLVKPLHYLFDLSSDLFFSTGVFPDF